MGRLLDLMTKKWNNARALVDSVKSVKTADELLRVYDNREDKLRSNLTKMKSKQEGMKMQSRHMDVKSTSVNALVDITNPRMTTKELLQVCD